jgi:hypothetical protein
MKSIYTDIEISASPDRIWNILLDVNKYPEWNPFIINVEGVFKEGEKIKVTLHQVDSKPMVFKPRCKKLNIAKELRWLGHLFIPGLFDGEHIFELQTLENGNTKFIQREKNYWRIIKRCRDQKSSRPC